MINVRKRFPSGCCCLNSQNKNSEKVFRKTSRARGMKTTGAVLITVSVIALTVLISHTVHKTYFSAPLKVVPVEQNGNSEEAVLKGIKALMNPENIRANLLAVTKKAHVAGTENNLRVAEIIRDQMKSQGLEDVHFNEYNVLLSYPNWTNPNTIEILTEDGKTAFKTTGRSPSLIKDEQTDPTAEIQWVAYSAEGVAEGDVVYVNKASYQDIAHVESLGIDLKDKILLVRYGQNFRGNIAQMAVKFGAKGCLLYSDPMQVASWGTGPNETFMSTDKMPPNAVQRGGIYIGSGDPRTPAFPSIGELYKERTEEDLYDAKLFPTIPVLPIPYSAAQVLFANMKGDAVIPEFAGSLNVTYRYGAGLINGQKLRMTVHAKNEEKKIQNVLGFIRGSQEPEKLVIVSNHYDAWTYGAVDPNSGTATLLEISRAVKEYQNKTGWAPARSILFAHWDAEEYGLIGSTEFVEEYRQQLMRRAVVVINMDLIGGNQTIFGIANPTVAGVLREASSSTVHPNDDERKEGRHTIYDSWKHFYPSKTNRSTHPFMRIPAGGSDHMPFFNYLGIPIIFFVGNSLDAPPAYPLYHTSYETPFLIEKILDPNFKMHKAVGELMIDMALRFTESKILPYDLRELMDDVIFDYLPKIDAHLQSALNMQNITALLQPAVKQFSLLQKTAEEVSRLVHQQNMTKMRDLSFNQRVDVNNRLIEFEKCFINPFGAPENPQSRHVLFYPSPEDWYNGHAISQVHDMITRMENSLDEKKLKQYSRQLAKNIAVVNLAFICAKHSFNELINPF